MLVIKADFTETSVRVYLVSLLHLFNFHLHVETILELLVIGLVGHHFISVGGAAHFWLIGFHHIHFYEIFALDKFTGNLGFSLENLELSLLRFRAC
jgi:hypothetical protein